jgi:hypothetical protein
MPGDLVSCSEDQARPCSIPMKCPRHYYGDLRIPLAHCVSLYDLPEIVRTGRVTLGSLAPKDSLLDQHRFAYQVGWLPVSSRCRRASGLRHLHRRAAGRSVLEEWSTSPTCFAFRVSQRERRRYHAFKRNAIIGDIILQYNSISR